MKKIIPAIVLSLASSMALAETTSDLRIVFGQDEIGTIGTISSAESLLDVDDSVETAAMGLILRTHFDDTWATEARYTLGGDDTVITSDGSLSSLEIDSTFFVSGIYKAPQVKAFTPYAKLGLGLIDMATNNLEFKEYTYVAGLGIDYHANDNFVIGIEYEYFGGGSYSNLTQETVDDVLITTGVAGDIDMSRASINFGIKF